MSVQIRQQLLVWYDKHHRVLPWRRNCHSTRQAKADDLYEAADPKMPQQQFAYFVWVCEVMSQQTQVARVAEYFLRWTSKWPTLQVSFVCLLPCMPAQKAQHCSVSSLALCICHILDAHCRTLQQPRNRRSMTCGLAWVITGVQSCFLKELNKSSQTSGARCH